MMYVCCLVNHDWAGPELNIGGAHRNIKITARDGQCDLRPGKSFTPGVACVHTAGILNNNTSDTCHFLQNLWATNCPSPHRGHAYLPTTRQHFNIFHCLSNCMCRKLGVKFKFGALTATHQLTMCQICRAYVWPTSLGWWPSWRTACWAEDCQLGAHTGQAMKSGGSLHNTNGGQTNQHCHRMATNDCCKTNG